MLPEPSTQPDSGGSLSRGCSKVGLTGSITPLCNCIAGSFSLGLGNFADGVGFRKVNFCFFLGMCVYACTCVCLKSDPGISRSRDREGRAIASPYICRVTLKWTGRGALEPATNCPRVHCSPVWVIFSECCYGLFIL